MKSLIGKPNEFMHDLELFMTGQRNENGIEGIGFEVGFGTGQYTASEDSIEPLSNTEPVAIALRPGRVIRLRGRIDRINQLADGSYEIVDYKTGKFWRPGWKGVFAQGTRLQHALYSIAARWLLNARGKKNVQIRHAAYLFPTERGWYQRFEIPQDGGKRVLDVLNDLCDVIEAGAFVHAAESESCKWCEFSAACGRERFDCAATKLASPATDVLGSFRRLKEHDRRLQPINQSGIVSSTISIALSLSKLGPGQERHIAWRAGSHEASRTAITRLNT